MISVGSIDGRKLSGLGLEMEENELEEGEAGCFQNDGDDSTIDPDIALSYIGEKLQNVLGHFQKDFEGGVSVENLGAKFGGYGSFLPTYQRSPSWSRQRSSPEVHNHSGQRFPNNLHSEDGRENSVSSTSGFPSARPGTTSGKTASTIGDSVKRDASIPSTHEVLTSNVGHVKRSGNPSEQRTLKVRIKVGAENLSTRQNAEIYSGLGLDVSPSSSLDDNPIVGKGLCGNNQEVPDESPTSILQVMTSFPVHGGLLLSPLSDDLICLFENGMSNGMQKNESKLLHKAGLESSGVPISGSLSCRSDQKVLDQKKWNSSGKDHAFSTQVKNEKNNDSLPKKETDIDFLGCEELVSNALKLPLLSSSQHGIGYNPTKGPPKEVDSSAEKYDDLLPPGNVWEIKKENFGIENLDHLQDDAHKTGKPRRDSNSSKGRKALGAEANNSSKELAVKKEVSSNEEVEKITLGNEQLSSGARKKSKGAQSGGSQGSDVSKDQLMLESSSMPKYRKSSLGNNLMPKNDSLDLKTDHRKPGDRYKDFFGDLELEDEESESISAEKRSSVERHSASKERSDVKKIEKPSPYTSRTAPETGSRPTSDATPAGVAPFVKDKEDWVQCDRCHQWRLLPLGTNPKSLPDKWRCRMLTWLPGMNRCSIPEEETARALRASYNPAPTSAPAPITAENQHNLPSCPDRTMLGVSSVDAKFDGQIHQNIGSQDLNGGKKRYRTGDVTNSADLDDPTPISDPQKKYVKVSENKGASRFPSVDAHQHMHHSSSAVVDVLKDNKKDKRLSLEGHPNRGTISKVRNKRESDSESFGVSKKVKSENVGDENWTSDDAGASSKARHSSSGRVNDVAGTDRRQYDNTKDSRADTKKLAKNLETNEHKIESDNQERKGEEHQGLPGEEQQPKDHKGFVEETHESNHGKEKKTRISKSEGKDTSRSKGDVVMDKKGRGIKEQQIGNAADHSKSSMQANSSSSKVSGSCKTKPGVHEMKGSPVESVSSSPFRFVNAGRNTVHKDEFQDNGVLTIASPDLGTRKEECQDEERTDMRSSGHQTKKSGKGHSSRSKDKTHSSRSDIDKGKNKISDSTLESADRMHSYEEKLKSGRNKRDEKSVTSEKVDRIFGSKKDSAEGITNNTGKEESQLKFGSHDRKQKLQQDQDVEKSAKKGPSDRVGVESNGRGKSHSLPPLARGQAETVASISASKKENGDNSLAIDAFENGDASKAHRQVKKAEKNGSHPFNTRHPTPEVHKGRDLEAPSPLRRDSSSHAAANAVKEAKALKHMADRLKSSGSTESTGLYFQAALKFLHGASLLEAGNSDSTKHNETIQSTQMYSSTAKLCEFCAHEYEKLKDMAAAALAYKCTEVAYMKVIYSSHSSASRDRNELQTALQIVPPGESPSSSASDVDNVNNQSTVDKAALAKGVSSPQVAGSNVITPKNRSSFMRLLNYAQDVNFAMEASRKSRIAFAAAANPRLGETQHSEGTSSVKKALDFNFQDVDGLLRLVRVAMEAISR